MSDTQNKIETLQEIDENILLADGFEGALIGYGRCFNRIFAVYDETKCLDILVNRDGMTYEEAQEFFEINVIGSYVGEYTPSFVNLFEKGDIKC